MAEIKNSMLLEKLLEAAKAIPAGAKGAVTAERFLLAAINSLSGTAANEEEAFEHEKIRSILRGMLKTAAEDFSDVKADLEKRVAESAPSQMVDSIYMVRQLENSRRRAEEMKSQEITSYLVLGTILLAPDGSLKKLIDAHSGMPEGEAPAAKRVEDIIGEKLPERAASEAGAAAAPAEPEGTPKQRIADLTARTKKLYEVLSSTVLGQENAVSVFTTGFFRAELSSMTDKSRTRPRATFLFAGPPGVGKTFLAESAAKALGLPFMRFDMSEYCDKEASIEFIGSDAVYKNSKKGNFTSFVQEHPKSVILLDEIEKAHISIIHLFLQILDAGRIRDSQTDEEISLSDTILIFTTNAGRQLYEKSETGIFSGLSRKVILKALQQDISPATGMPYFPAAICSRFSSGNVVMFNQISAYNLRKIAKREISRQAENLKKEIGISVELDDRIYSAILFAEGGAADARAVKSRAEAFFDDELYELLRLVSSAKCVNSIENIDSIAIKVQLPPEDSAPASLFMSKDKPRVMVLSNLPSVIGLRNNCPDVEFIQVKTEGDVKRAMHEGEVSFMLLDLGFGGQKTAELLNIEDVESVARDIFWFVKENYSELPIYILETDESFLNDEEKMSYYRQGVRGFLSLDGDWDKTRADLDAVCEMLHQQSNMTSLAKANKLLTYETSQIVETGGGRAEITLFDFELSVAVDSGDTENVLSNVSKPDVSFEDVIGAEDAKKELKYFVEYLKNPRKFMGTGVAAPKGVLLYGPPGTGKTMLAKAMAHESDVTFITAEGNQFLKKYVGEGPEKMHELFKTARKYAPAIIFIDEIDAIAKDRMGDEGTLTADDVLTAMLAEMDGFKRDLTKPVFVLAATNYNVEPGTPRSLDAAFLRRFDRRVLIDLPNSDERERYIRMKLGKNSAFEVSEEKIRNIVTRSTGMSLASLESAMELALRMAIRDGNMKVTDAIFDDAFETFNSGETKKWDDSTVERVARHEAGHAFLCWQSGETPSYVTIVARGDHGGYMQHDSNEGKAILTRDELLARIRVSLGGRASELVYYGENDGVSTGASGDLANATEVATRLICRLGMDDSFGLAVIDRRSLSGEQAREVRAAVNRILAEEMRKAIALISENRAAIDALVEALKKKNHLTGTEIDAIFSASASR